MKKFLVFGAVLALAVLAVLDFTEQEKQDSARHLRPRGLEMRRQAAVGTWALPMREASRPAEPVHEANDRPVAAVDSPQGITDRYLMEHGEELGLKPWHELRPSVFQTPLGARVNYQVFQDGLPILGAELHMRLGRDNVVHLENQYLPLEKVDVNPKDAIDTAQVHELMKVSNYLPDPSVGTEPAKILVPVQGTNRAELVYVVSAREPGGSRRPVQVLLRASDGQVLGKNYSRMEFGN